MDELVGLNQTKCILKRETTTTKIVSHDIEPWKEMAERKTQRIEIKSTISNLKITQYKLPVTRYGSSRMKIDLKHVTHKELGYEFTLKLQRSIHFVHRVRMVWYLSVPIS